MTQLSSDELKVFLQNIISTHKNGNSLIDLQGISAPCDIDEALQDLGYIRKEWNSNGWEGDNCIYYTSEDNEISFDLFFCAWTFELHLIFGTGED